MKKNNKDKVKCIGGIALGNGIILKSETKETVTTMLNDNKINVNIKETFCNNNKFDVFDLPFIRGFRNIILQFFNSKENLKNTMRYIGSALNIDYDESDVNINISSLIFTLIFLLIVIFIAIPIAVSIPVTNMKNIFQVIIQLLLFGSVLMFFRFNKGLSELLEYHGAEHKVINTYEEKLNLEDITLENVLKASRIHKRCGTNLISFYILLTVLEMIFLPIQNLLLKFCIMSILSVLNISVAYEIIASLPTLPNFISYIFYPAMMVQYLTTKAPSKEKVELAIYGIKPHITDELSASISDVLTKYKREITTEKIKNYTYQDMLKIVSYVTNKNIGSIYASLNDKILSYNEQIEIRRLLNLMIKEDMPIQYITQKAYFYNEEYIVNSNVLIPREDTEILVQKAIEYINKYELKEMIDLCTGSGCIGISTANNSNIQKVILSDISKEALNVARENITLNNASDKVITYHSDLLKLYIEKKITTDIIVSNPPYIKTDDIEKLDKKVQKEPHIALDGGKTGMDVYIKILDQADKVIKENGYLMFEIGYDELEEIKKIASTYKKYEFIEEVKDYGGNDRVVIFRVLK